MRGDGAGRRCSVAVALLVVGALAAAVAGCSGPGEAPRSPGSGEAPRSPGPADNVVVVVLDCLRADHMGLYGYARDTTPELDRLAADSVVFDQAIAPSNWTKPSVVSLLTGLYVSEHRVVDGRLHEGVPASEVRAHVVPESLTTLAEPFSDAGYATAGFVNQGHMPAYMGFDQGFDVYEADLQDGLVHRRFLEWIDGLEDRPFFAYLHFLNLHFPYRPREEENLFVEEPGLVSELMWNDPAALRRRIESGELTDAGRRELEALYDGRIRNVDGWARNVARGLEERGLLDSTLVVVTSDHGEAFLEHGHYEHGGDNLYSEVVRVPLIMRFPGARHGGSRVVAPVQLVDLYPTLLDHAGLEVPAHASGFSLLPRIGGEERRWPVLSETSDPDGPKALYRGPFKYLFQRDGGVEVYDWARDPAERDDLSARLSPAVHEAARRELDRLLAENAAFLGGEVELTGLGARELEKLRQLGYIR